MNTGDGIDYHQRFGENIGDLIQVHLNNLLILKWSISTSFSVKNIFPVPREKIIDLGTR